MSEDADTTIAGLLAGIEAGDPDGVRRLFPLIYDELRELARVQRRRRRYADTLNTTALVHEAFLKLVRAEGIGVQDRAHFMAVAANAMRHILISYARSRSAVKRGAGRATIPFDEIEGALESGSGFSPAHADALLALDAALVRLAERSDRQMRVVDCRFFGGMSIEETAAALGVSPATVKRDWSMAQAWLYREMQEAP